VILPEEDTPQKMATQANLVKSSKEDLIFYTMTFRISKSTLLTSLKSTACDFWGLTEKHYRLFSVSGEPISNIADESDSNGRLLTVDKFFETLEAEGGAGDKQEEGHGSRKAILYLSSDALFADLRKAIKAQR
jgi:hypothetical protein